MDMVTSAENRTQATAGLAPIPMRYRDPTEGFGRGWYCVAEARDVTAEAMLPVTYLGLPLIVYRDRTGTAHVSDAWCPHLGAHLASHTGRIEGGEIVCPFHQWRFDAASGKCTSIPYSKSIPPQAKLKSYPVREIAGMVMMWYHAEGAEPDFEPFDPVVFDDKGPWILTGEEIRQVHVPAREMFENLFDTAHIQQLHGSADQPDIDRVLRTENGIRIEYDQPMEGKVSITGQQFNFSGLALMSHIVEGIGFGMKQDISATPIDGEYLQFHARLYIKDTGDAEMNQLIGAGFVGRVLHEIRQDLAVLEYKKHLPRPLICAGDGPIMRYREYAQELLS